MGRRRWNDTGARATQRLTVYVSADLRRALDKAAHASNLKLSEYARRLLDGQPLSIMSHTDVRQAIAAINAIGRELRGWGANLNQALHHANEARLLGIEAARVAEHLEERLADIAADRERTLIKLDALELRFLDR